MAEATQLLEDVRANKTVPQWHYAVKTGVNDGYCNSKCAYGVHWHEAEGRFYRMPDEAIVSWRHGYLTCPNCGLVASSEHEYTIRKHTLPWSKKKDGDK